MLKNNGLPEGWKITEIKHLICKTKNENPSKDYPNELFNYVDISSINVKEGKITSSTEILGIDAPSRARQKVKTHDLLISTVRPNLNAVALVPEELDGQICSTGFCILRFKENVSPKYLFYFSRTAYFVESLIQRCRGANYPAVTNKDVLSVKIPLPSYQTQKKIVEILEKAEKLKEWRTEANELAYELCNSYFLEMFGDPIKNQKGFETDLLKNLCELKSGGTPSRKNSEYFEGDIPWITTVALGPTFIGYNDAVEYITEDAIQKSATKLIPVNSIIFGTRVGVGKASINKCDICTNQDITAMVNLDKRLNKDFLLQIFKYYEKYFESQIRGATIKGITSKTLKELNIIIPPIELQNKFAEIVQQIETQKSYQSQSKQQINNLFNTIMQKAFKGELVC